MKEVSVKGKNGQITLKPKRVIIKRKGFVAFAGHGLKGDKEIPIKNITAVQFKSAGIMTNGYIQLSILGGLECRGGLFDATKDENTVFFSKAKENGFKEIKKYIDAIIDEEPISIDELNIYKLTSYSKTSSNSDFTEENNGKNELSSKSIVIASLLSLFLGGLGIGRFYLGNIGLGVGKLLTFGGFGLWAFIDFIYIVSGNAKDGKGLKVK